MANLFIGRSCNVDGRAGRFLAFRRLAGEADAIVEFADGVEYVDPTKLCFTDLEHANLCAMQKYLNEKKENET